MAPCRAASHQGVGRLRLRGTAKFAACNPRWRPAPPVRSAS
jgi:hypothetical protein